MCEGLIAAVARLFAPFGSQDHVPALFGPHLDPLKVHSGLTNAAVADHINVGMDGRKDYQRYFGIRLPFFFLSNASNNLCFLTPLEAQQQRAHDMGGQPGPQLAEPGPLPDMPRWTLHLSGSDQSALAEYRSHVRQKPPKDPSMGESILQHILGLHDVVSGGGGDNSMPNSNWFSSLVPACTDVTPGGSGSREGGRAARSTRSIIGAGGGDGCRETFVRDGRETPGFANVHASPTTQHAPTYAGYSGVEANHVHRSNWTDSVVQHGHSHMTSGDAVGWQGHSPPATISYGDSGGAAHYYDEQPGVDYYSGSGNAMGALGEH